MRVHMSVLIRKQHMPFQQPDFRKKESFLSSLTESPKDAAFHSFISNHPSLPLILRHRLSAEYLKKEDKFLIAYLSENIGDLLYSAFHPDLPQQMFECQLKDNQNLSDDNFFIEKNSFSPPIAQSSFSGNLYHGESINSYPAPLSDKYGDSPIKSLPRSDSFRPNKNSNESLRESQPTIRNKVSKNNIKSSISVDSFMSDIKKRELSEVSDLSFEILRSPPKELSLALLKGNHLQHEAIKIVTQANPNRLALYRVAHLTFYALIEKSHDFSINCCGYIFQFLSFIHELSISDFYEGVCSHTGDKFKSTHNWLVEHNFSSIVANEIWKEKKINEDEHIDKSVQRMRHLFILVRNCLKSPILRESFQSSEILNAVMSSSLNVADTIENERWITLTDLYCDKLKDRMHDLLFRTFNIISTSKKEVKRYHVAALDLLTLIMKNDQTTHQFFIKTRIHEVLLNLMFQFPHHTFLHLSIVNHIKIAMTIPIIQNKIVTHLLEPVILEGSKSEATVLTGTSYAILNEALNLLKKNKWLVEELKKIPECEEFIKDEMIPRLNLIKNGYGGSY